MNATIEVVNASGTRSVPRKHQFHTWATAALNGAKHKGAASVSLRLVDEKEGRKLNSKYRNKAHATNVLSFPVPASLPASGYLGDIALCTAIVKKEAKEQGKLALDHWAHLTVHGVLHLLGYDHERVNDAKKMEALEVRILHKLGIDNPYLP